MPILLDFIAIDTEFLNLDVLKMSKLESFIHFPYDTNVDLLERWQNTLKMLAITMPKHKEDEKDKTMTFHNDDRNIIEQFKKFKFQRVEKIYLRFFDCQHITSKGFLPMFPLAVAYYVSCLSCFSCVIRKIDNEYSSLSAPSSLLVEDTNLGIPSSCFRSLPLGRSPPPLRRFRLMNVPSLSRSPPPIVPIPYPMTFVESDIKAIFKADIHLNRFVFHDALNRSLDFILQGTGNCLKVTELNRLIWQRLEETSEEIDRILSEHFMLDTFFQQGFT